MKHRPTTLYLGRFLLAGCLGLASIAGAAEGSVEDSAAMLPEVQVSNGISYLSGGVGLDEREAMRSARHGYNLWLSFTRKRDAAYAADTEVTIRDARGRLVLEAFSEGPWLMVKLPIGRYRVTARHEGGEAITQRVSVSSKSMTRYVLRMRESEQS